jgi:hypothetical protein
VGDRLEQSCLGAAEVVIAKVTDAGAEGELRLLPRIRWGIRGDGDVEKAGGGSPRADRERLLASGDATSRQACRVDPFSGPTQVVGDLRGPATVDAVAVFELIGELEVEALATPATHVVIQDVSQQGVVEVVPLAIVMQQGGRLGLLQPGVEVRRSDGLQIGEQPDVADEGGLGEQAATRCADPVESPADLVVEPARKGKQLGAGADQLTTADLHIPGVGETAEQRAGQQRVAVGGFDERRQQGTGGSRRPDRSE